MIVSFLCIVCGMNIIYDKLYDSILIDKIRIPDKMQDSK